MKTRPKCPNILWYMEHSGTFVFSEKGSNIYTKERIKQIIKHTHIFYGDYLKPYTYHMLQLITSFLQSSLPG